MTPVRELHQRLISTAKHAAQTLFLAQWIPAILSPLKGGRPDAGPLQINHNHWNGVLPHSLYKQHF
jgi:hypothetical protein